MVNREAVTMIGVMSFLVAGGSFLMVLAMTAKRIGIRKIVNFSGYQWTWIIFLISLSIFIAMLYLDRGY